MNQFGRHLRLSIAGESHGPAIVGIVDGLPPGMPIDEELIRKRMRQRRPGQSSLVTSRNEADEVQILSGTFHGRTTGAPLAFQVLNEDTRAKDYSELAKTARPGHADYPEHVASGGHRDHRGGGHSSGRLTLVLVAVAAILEPLRQAFGVTAMTYLHGVGNAVMSDWLSDIDADISEQDIPCPDPQIREAMRGEIEAAKSAKTSVGAELRCIANGMPPGIGAPWFDSLESQIAHLLFAIPAVKAVGFGSAWDAARMQGHEHNDAMCLDDGQIGFATNHHGGILGGRSSGAQVRIRATIKPTSSIFQPQDTVFLDGSSETKLELKGRHDPCIGLRATPVVQAAVTIALLDALMDGVAAGLVEVPTWSK